MSAIPISIGKRPGDLTWQEKGDKATRMICAILVSGPNPVPVAELRGEVLRHAREALGDAPTAGMIRSMELPGGPEDVGSLPSIFRLILEQHLPGYSDPVVAERFMVVVQRALDDELARPNPGHYPPRAGG